MSETERREQHPQHSTRAAQAAPRDQPMPLPEIVERRLAAAPLSEPVKGLLREVLGGCASEATAPIGRRIYLGSVAVTGFRGIGPRTLLKLCPRPGVNLVVGRNGSGKSSVSEGIETAFTGTNGRWQGQHVMRSSNWRNLHHGAEPNIEVKLAFEGDPGSSTLTRTWSGEDYGDSEGWLRRPGHGRVPIGEVGWERAMTDYRPFLSYVDLDRMINGKPAQMYDVIATILGLGPLNAAHQRLREEAKALDNAVRAVKEELPAIKEALYALQDDDRAVEALVAIDTAGHPDFQRLESLVAGLPASDDGVLAELRATVEMRGPDVARVGRASDRLRDALANVEDIRETGAEDALRLADLLERALEHSNRHPDDKACAVCGTGRPLDRAWAASAAEKITVLRREARAAAAAHGEVRSAAQAVRDLLLAPAWFPVALADPWNAWIACRTITDPAELAQRVHETAAPLADACAAARESAAKELERRDERWRLLVTRLAAWVERARAAEEGEPRFGQIRKALAWIKALSAELRDQRMERFTGDSQRIWERLRQESSIELRAVALKGSEKANVRKLVMDVAVDGVAASALSVMSQGEQHSLALSLFLPRAATADSPFGFVVIDDPVQSMDPAKVNGLAQVLHELGEHRQVVVFTHDTRLQRAFTSQELPVTVFEVERGESSKVKVRRVTDPVAQALDDARALASTSNLPEEARTHVLPGLCRAVLENALLEAAWIRCHRSGGSELELQAAVTDAEKFRKVAALALFGDIGRTPDVDRELRARYGARAAYLVRQCQDGSHVTGARITDPHAFVTEIGKLAHEMRKPEVAP